MHGASPPLWMTLGRLRAVCAVAAACAAMGAGIHSSEEGASIAVQLAVDSTAHQQPYRNVLIRRDNRGVVGSAGLQVTLDSRALPELTAQSGPSPLSAGAAAVLSDSLQRVPIQRPPGPWEGREAVPGRSAALSEVIPSLYGPPGPMGPLGPKGNSGKDGERGDPGTTGAQGLVGQPGPKGGKGRAGRPGPKGKDGPQGDPGVAPPPVPLPPGLAKRTMLIGAIILQFAAAGAVYMYLQGELAKTKQAHATGPTGPPEAVQPGSGQADRQSVQ